MTLYHQFNEYSNSKSENIRDCKTNILCYIAWQLLLGINFMSLSQIVLKKIENYKISKT